MTDQANRGQFDNPENTSDSRDNEDTAGSGEDEGGVKWWREERDGGRASIPWRPEGCVRVSIRVPGAELSKKTTSYMEYVTEPRKGKMGHILGSDSLIIVSRLNTRDETKTLRGRDKDKELLRRWCFSLCCFDPFKLNPIRSAVVMFLFVTEA
ncbi:hypothetical protein D5F01_LYC07626 [Larimichthys crocea]|uniref:Uncharacterized protein n=1 Tax=Larimichthys crocea TaxID=215358 RepID=A0A6G0IT19_LARCR|nr:hypothetical protein D5F01_LYC07626 [Larimichthys crocea]